MRARSADGEWSVEVVHLTLTGNHRDGAWLKVCRLGWFVAELRSVEELAKLIDLSKLEEALVGRLFRLRGEWSTSS
jgi:hypothetical protein